MMYCIAASPVV